MCLLCVLLTVGQTEAAVLLHDDFSDGVADGWTEVLGIWTVLAEEYVGTSEDPQGNRDMLATTGDLGWTSYTLSARMKLVPPESEFNDFGLVFYAQGDEFIRFTLGAEAEVSPPTARIGHFAYVPAQEEYDSVADLAHHVSEPTMVVGQWYDVSLCLYEDNVSAYVDGRLVAYADNLPLTQGYIGLMADTPTAYFDDVQVTSGTSVFFPDYMPLDPSEHGVKTFAWTYGQTGQYTSVIGDTQTIPYTSGVREGVEITNHSDWGTMIVSNDGACVRFLAGQDAYLSTDTLLSDHPGGYVFGAVYDGLLIDQGQFHVLSADLSVLETVDNQMLLITIQDVTVSQGSHEDAVVVWYLDTDFSFTPLDFHGKEVDLGLALPSSADTAGYAPTGVEIYALGTGLIAHGDIAADTGSLNNLAELQQVAALGGLYRFWSPQHSRHFYTISEGEKDGVIATYPPSVWTYEGVAYYAFIGESQLGLAPVYRFWSPLNSAHFYTISEAERDSVIATYPDSIWTYEGVAFYAYPSGSQPDGTSAVYRFWSPLLSGHFYTISEVEKNAVIATYPPSVWTYEDIAWYAYE
jgi:hypothetical protein